MGERPRPSERAFGLAEVMHLFLEAEYQEERRDVDEMFMRLKDLSAYSLEHAEIMDQREGAELLGLGMFFGFFGMSSNPNLRDKQQRLRLLSEEALSYEGRKENIAADIAGRKAGKPARPDKDVNSPIQRRLL